MPHPTSPLLLTAVPDDLRTSLATLFVIAVIAAAAPLVVGLLRLRVAEVVLLIGMGIVFGPQVLGLIRVNDTIETFNELGLGMLFFLAGFELEQRAVQGRSGRLALTGWLTSLAIAFVLTAGLWALGIVHDLAGLAIALTSTALGTLLPVVRDRGALGTPFGTYFMGAGAAGEFGPIVAIALLLGSHSVGVTLVTLVVFGLFSWIVWRAPARFMTDRMLALMDRGHHTSSQTAVRWTVVLLLFLLGLAASFGLDAVLGAFVAGVILRRYAPPGERNRLAPKIEAIGFGFFVPLFFVVSGAKLDIRAILDNPFPMLIVFVLLLLVRGLPQLVLYRSALPDVRERWQFTLYVATALPILVAITALQVDEGLMRTDSAAALVGAGALSVLVFPLLGDRINRDAVRALEDAADGSDHPPPDAEVPAAPA